MTAPGPAFAEVPRTAAGHLELVGHAAVCRVAYHLRETNDADSDEAFFAQHPVLARHLALCQPFLPPSIPWEEMNDWWKKRIGEWHPLDEGFPLRQLGRLSGTGFEGEIAAVLAGCVEDDPGLGALFARIQATPGTRRPSIGLLEAFTNHGERSRISTVERLLCGGWLRVEEENQPRAERPVRLAIGVWELLRERPPRIDGAVVHQATSASGLKRLLLDEPVRTQAARIPRMLEKGQARAVVVRGPDGAGRVTAMRSIARALRRGVLLMERADSASEPPRWNEVGPFCMLARLMPVVSLAVQSGDSTTLRRPAGYDGPLGVVLGRRGSVSGPAVDGAIHIDVRMPVAHSREQLWRRAIPPGFIADCDALATRYRVAAGTIERAARLASGFAAVDNRVEIGFADVRRGLGVLNHHVFESLADRVEPARRDDALVVSEQTRHDLDDLEMRCRHRERLSAVAGATASGVTPGVRALFTGPTGTGKTLAACELARRLEMDLYRLDLASLVNKYIGETEKNLDRVLSHAEEHDVILLLDEGDALMTSRTDVKTSNDRYANLETNFLLQRLEAYEGILVITTNAAQRIDDAFMRRIDAKVEFTAPATPERREILRRHLPAGHAVSDRLIDAVAEKSALSGGQIRNATLYATLIALDDGAHSCVTDRHLEDAVRREMRRAGAASPSLVHAPGDDEHAHIRRLDEITRSLAHR